MSKKFEKELMQLDLYEILGLNISAEEKQIKKSYRKKALACHPDKNPDNPNAAEEFNRLKKILEILLDVGARTAYDKVLKSRKAAALRAKEANTKSHKLKAELERREKVAQVARDFQQFITEEEKFRRELKRLEEEGERIIAEELERVNKEVESEFSKAFGSNPSKKSSDPPACHRVKVKWVTTNNWKGYTTEEINQLMYKWGEINAVVVNQKDNKGTALVEFKDSNGANMAAQFEKGLIGKPVEVTQCTPKESKLSKKSSKASEKRASSRDFESISAMNQRREFERKKLIEEMMKNENS